MSEAPEIAATRRGPRSQIALLERTLRRHRLLARDDHIIEWRQGWIRRWRVDGFERPVPAFTWLRRALKVGWMSTFSYSSRAVFLHFGNTFLAADLARVCRLEGTGNGSLCMIDSSIPAGLGSVQWTTGDLEEDDAQLVGLTTRILAQRDHALAGMAPDLQQQIARELAALEDSGMINAEFDRASAPVGGT